MGGDSDSEGLTAWKVRGSLPVMPKFIFTRKPEAVITPSAKFSLVKEKSKPPVVTPPTKQKEEPKDETHPIEVGKAAFFEHDGARIAGVVAKYANGKATLRLAIPDENGLLMVSDSEVETNVDSLTPCEAVCSDRKVSVWESNEPLLQDGTKGVAIRDQATNRIVDYTDVMFAGYGSTFAHVTPKDRDGDGVMVGAFTETIKEFKRNPVMLIDHRNSVENIAGSYTQIMQDDIGLKLVGQVSNAPELRKVRFLIMEGHLKTLSMGGIFIYQPDGKTIEKVYLFEVSLVAVPANPDATFQARSLDLDSATKMFKRRRAINTTA